LSAACDTVPFDGASCADPYIQELVRRLGIPLAADIDGETRWQLAVRGDALVLEQTGRPDLRPLSVDLVRTRRRFKSLPVSRRGPLARALGRSTGTLIDATAGWGQDAVLAWMMGLKVTAIERSSVIGALLQDGVRRFERCEHTDGRMQIVVADARTCLPHLSADCVYLDPMFPPRRKASALARRPLRVLRELVGNDDDRDELFECAWRAANRRVVTKRPVYAKPWRQPDQTFSGKMMCYDLYLKRP
jgi:16S rRNA (guanine1516-N2)-methyltransferase